MRKITLIAAVALVVTVGITGVAAAETTEDVSPEECTYSNSVDEVSPDCGGDDDDDDAGTCGGGLFVSPDKCTAP